MKHLIFNVNSQSLRRVDNFKPAAGSVEYLTAFFEFNSDWSGTSKTAKCRAGAAIYNAVISSDGFCVIPWEVLAVNTAKQMFGKQDFYIWVEGINGTKTITTDEIKIVLNVQGAGGEQNASDPTETIYAQFVADVKAETKASADTATAKATEAATSAESAAVSAASLKNDYSNALKGYANGAVVCVDDVSPVEHNPKVKVVCPEDVDPSTVTVTRCGKNLITFPYVDGGKGDEHTDAGITYRVNADGSITANGTATTNSYFRLCNIRFDNEYIYENTTNGNFACVDCQYDNKNNATFIMIRKGDAVNNKVYYPQVEKGEAKTEWECPKERLIYTPSTDGTIEGVTSLSPTMTLLTDTDNITIECEYNRDINKVIADILTTIAGG
jgi:hypothetical protein